MKKIVLIGGTNVDILAHSYNKLILNDSNPGYIKKTWGGVGRNIAENLARLELEPTFITVLGKDANEFISMAKSINLNLKYVSVPLTSSYIAIHDNDGDLKVSLSAMDSMNKLNPSFLKKHHEKIEETDLIILDANISDESLKYIFETYQKPIYVDVISSTKALKFLPFLSQIDTIKINLQEGHALTTENDPVKIGNHLLKMGIKNIFLTLGSNGAFHFNKNKTEFYQKEFDGKIENDTGAGDAFFAGTIFANISGLNPLKTGTILAQLTLQSKDSVYKNIKINHLLEMIKENT